MPFKDPERKKEYRRKGYAENSKSEIAHVKRRKDEIRKWFWEYKKSLKCSKCSEAHPAIIDFHHKKDKEKEMAISYMVANGFSIKKIKEELNKCQVVCANCHRKIHNNNKL